MTAAPLLLACLLAPPDTAAGEPETGLALQRQAVAQLEAALDAPLAEPFAVGPGDTLSDVVADLLPDHVVLTEGKDLDWVGSELRELPVDAPVALPAGRFSTRTAFELTLDAIGHEPLTLRNAGGVLLIADAYSGDTLFETRIYPVRDLLTAAGPAFRVPPIPYEDLVAAVQAGGFNPSMGGRPLVDASAVQNPKGTTPPDDPAVPLALAAQQPLVDLIVASTGGQKNRVGWKNQDGRGGTIEAFDGVLTIRQNQANHRQIETLLADLRAAFAAHPWSFSEASFPAGDPLPAGVALRRRSAAELDAALDLSLAAAARFEAGTPLAAALAALLPDQVVLPDRPRLSDVGLDLRTIVLEGPVRLPAGLLPVRRAVEIVLAGCDVDEPLAACNDGGVLKITTREHAERFLVTRVYPTRDLLEKSGPRAAPRQVGRYLHRVKTTPPAVCNIGSPTVPLASCDPETPLDVALAARNPLFDMILNVTGGYEGGGPWERTDGRGGALEEFDGVLVVRQTQAVHRQIETLLAGLRAANAVRPWTFPADRSLPVEEIEEEPTE